MNVIFSFGPWLNGKNERNDYKEKNQFYQYLLRMAHRLIFCAVILRMAAFFVYYYGKLQSDLGKVTKMLVNFLHF